MQNSNNTDLSSSRENQNIQMDAVPINTFKQILGIFLRGMAMGTADVVPGVSGGTIAFITGIYARLIQALTSADKKFFTLLIQFKIADAFKYIDGVFLMCLFVGIVLAFVSFAHLIDHLLLNYPILVWSVFFGLILASAALLFLQNIQLKIVPILLFCLGILAMLLLANSRINTIQPSLPIIFFAGMIAISALLLPGLSGSFLLLIFGLYEPMIAAVKGFDIAFILSFAIGAICGLMLFSRVIDWLLKHFYVNTLMLLIGMLFGSLYAVWPWRLDEGIMTVAVSPIVYTSETTFDAMLWPAIICALMAAGLVLFFELFSRRLALSDEASDKQNLATQDR